MVKPKTLIITCIVLGAIDIAIYTSIIVKARKDKKAKKEVQDLLNCKK